MLYKITFSPTGGTDRIADLLGDYLSKSLKAKTSGINLLVRDPDRRQSLLRETDIAVIAMPVFGGRIPAVAASRLRMIRGNGSRAIVAAVYGNRAYDDSLRELADIAEASGFRGIAAIAAIAEHSIIHEIAQGRPDDEDRSQLARMAEEIAGKLDRNDDSRPSVPGSWPYKVFHGIPLGTYATDDCIFCTSCALECPVGAIPEERPNQPSNGSCISCMRCVAVCPVQARRPDDAVTEVIRHKISPVCVERKEAELFI